MGPPFFREYSQVYLLIDHSGLVAQLTAESPLFGRTRLERFYDHLRKGQQVIMLRSQCNITNAKVIEITAPAPGNIADVR